MQTIDRHMKQKRQEKNRALGTVSEDVAFLGGTPHSGKAGWSADSDKGFSWATAKCVKWLVIFKSNPAQI